MRFIDIGKVMVMIQFRARNGTKIKSAGGASGIYLYRITSGSGYMDTKRMTLVK